MALFIFITSLVDGLSTTPQILILFFILTTEEPLPRAWAYIAGISFFYLAAGIFASFPFTHARDLFRLVNSAVDSGPDTVYYVVQIAVGFALLAAGFVYYFRKPKDLDRQGRVARLLGEAGVVKAFLIGAVVTLGGLPGSVAYFAALDKLLTTGLTWPAQAAYIVFYNFVYILPLLVPLLAFILLHRRVDELAARLQRQVVRWNRFLMAIALLCLGLLLVADASFFFLTSHPIFIHKLL